MSPEFFFSHIVKSLAIKTIECWGKRKGREKKICRFKMKGQNGPNQNKERKIAWPFIPSHDLLKKE